GRNGEAKDAFFQALIPQAPAVLLPGQDLEAIPDPVAEDKPVPREGIVTEGLADKRAEAVEGLAQIHGGQAEETTNGRRQAQHDGCASAARRWRRAAGSKPCGIRRRRPLPRTSSRAGAAGGSVSWRTSMGTNVSGSSALAPADDDWPRRRRQA